MALSDGVGGEWVEDAEKVSRQYRSKQYAVNSMQYAVSSKQYAVIRK